MEVPAAVLERVRALYEQGFMLQAHEAAQAAGPLSDWTGPTARVLAGRLAVHLGAIRMALWHHVRAWRADRTHPEATYYFARRVLERRGPLEAWEFLSRTGELPESAPISVRADWLALHASVLGLVRDFSAAAKWLARAEALAPIEPWIRMERAALCEREDRLEDALAAARATLEMRPWYRPGVQMVAHLLVQSDRDAEAIALLEEADQRLENGPIVAQLASLHDELGHHAEVRRLCDRYEALSPLMEKDTAEWLAARRSDSAYHLGDFAAAATFARQAHDPFFTRIAERLEAAPEQGGRPVLLDVGFVRQNYQTCAPATLSALARFWGRPIEHLDVAAEICYDGTPDHRERHWTESHGFLVREFTVTWDAATALLNRGIPFTLTTVEPASAHLQAVIGHDALRGTFTIRDPSLRHAGEAIADRLIERYQGTGPRGMALVPAERAELFENLDLPDAALYDQFQILQRALLDHDRATALAAATAIEAAAPGHRLAYQARRVLATYDADRVALLASVEGLLGLYPGDNLWELIKLGCLRELATRDARLAFLGPICDRPDSDPVFLRQYASELAADARTTDRARRLLRRSIRRRPLDDASFMLLAELAADRRQFEAALQWSRFATCLDDKNEGNARAYFGYARFLKRTDEALAWLRAV